MAVITVEEVECPACGRFIDVDFDPDCDINDIDCPECGAPLLVEAWDPVRKVLLLEVEEDEEEDDAASPEAGVIDVEFEEEDEEDEDTPEPEA